MTRDPRISARTTKRAAQRAARCGFTLIEMIIVVGLLAIVVGMTVPRLTGNARQATVLAADSVADMLTLFAHRETMGNDRIALGYDSGSRAIMLLELVGDPQNPGDPLRWAIDRYVKPVRLPDDTRIVSVLEDNIRLDADEWMIPVIPGQGRPSIELTIEGATATVSIALPAHALAAHVVVDGIRREGDEFRSVTDLDALGRDQEVW
ncbi:MAG: type II secretion system protein [Phycisphaerales bacterium]